VEFRAFIPYEEIDHWVEEYVNHHEIARAETIGQSNEGRDIKAIHVTDNGLPVDDKEVVLIVIGRHGDELGTRVIGPALLEWLASEEAKAIIERQHIIVVPVANPDACVRAVFGLPVYHLSALEKKSILQLGMTHIPDLVLDIHSVGEEKFGFNWGGIESVVIDHAANGGEDQYILREMAGEMIDGAAQEGYPFLLHTLEPYQNLRKKADVLSELAYNNHFNGALYTSCHALTFGIEVNHFVLAPHETAESGLAVIKSALEMGNQVFPWEYYPGYPNRILSGDFLGSIRPRGKNAGERRVSRREIWHKRNFFESPFDPYREMAAPHSVKITLRYSGEEEIRNGLTVSFRVRGAPKMKRVSVNDGKIDYYTKEDQCSTYVFVDFETVRRDDVCEIVSEF
jgi:hypothetical protein